LARNRANCHQAHSRGALCTAPCASTHSLGRSAAVFWGKVEKWPRRRTPAGCCYPIAAPTVRADYYSNFISLTMPRHRHKLHAAYRNGKGSRNRNGPTGARMGKSNCPEHNEPSRSFKSVLGPADTAVNCIGSRCHYRGIVCARQPQGTVRGGAFQNPLEGADYYPPNSRP